MLGQPPIVEPAGQHADYGPLHRLPGLTGRERHVGLLVQADRLPMTIVEVSGDPAAALVVGAAWRAGGTSSVRHSFGKRCTSTDCAALGRFRTQ